MDSLVVQAMLAIYFAIAAIAVFLLWQNAAAPDALKNASIALASILPLVVSVFPYLNAEKLESKFTYILLYDSKEKRIIAGNPPNVYFSSYINMFTNLSLVPGATELDNWTQLQGPPGLDIVEKGILSELLITFGHNWDIIKTNVFRGPMFESYGFSNGPSTESAKVSIEELRKMFVHNRLVTTQGVIVSPVLVLPPKSKLVARHDENSRSFTITNPYVTLKVSFDIGSGGAAQHGIWGVLEPDANDMNRYYAVHYEVSAVMTLNRFKVHSPWMGSYRRWYANISDLLSKHDWEKVDEKIERFITRQAISKQLGLRE